MASGPCLQTHLYLQGKLIPGKSAHSQVTTSHAAINHQHLGLESVLMSSTVDIPSINQGQDQWTEWQKIIQYQVEIDL